MSLPETLARLRRHPGMYVTSTHYETIVAFVQGYDSALNGGLLVGFREWLIVKVDSGNNLSWPPLVLELMRGSGPPKKLRTVADQKAAIEFLFVTLEQFLADRDTVDGMRRIYCAYDDWLRRQDWYDQSSPDWIPRDRA